MADNRRQSENRRDVSGDANERRQKSDRRDDPVTKGGGNNDKKTASRRSAADKKGSKLSLKLLFKRVIAVLMIVVAVCAIFLIYVFTNFAYYKDQISKRIIISLDSVTLDPEKLTDRKTCVRLNFKVKNALPIGVTFQSLVFNVNISEYTVAKGMQASPKIAIEANKDSIVAVAFNVDSIVTRRALQKTIERNAGILLKGLLSRAQGNKDTLGDDIKALVKITGNTEFRLKAGGIELPFTRNLNF